MIKSVHFVNMLRRLHFGTEVGESAYVVWHPVTWELRPVKKLLDLCLKVITFTLEINF